MATSNRDRVGKALELLRSGLWPFVERELKAKFGEQWESKAREGMSVLAAPAGPTPQSWDAAALLGIIDTQWQYAFRFKLGKDDRTLIFELRGVRNRWAHQEPFNLDDTNRALDSVKRLLQAVNAPEAEDVDRALQEVLRQKYEELTKKEVKKASAIAAEGGGRTASGLPGWREVITPHPDVASGNYMKAEFAADLWQVYQDQFDKTRSAPREYTDPAEFFRRTHLTGGLEDLLTLGMKRVSGQAVDPVVKLQVNFGGGKTHSMLALYHLFGGTPAGKLVGVEPLLAKAGVSSLPKVNRAVLVGNRLSLMGFVKPDGIKVRTLWGEMAWQLGGAEGYAMVREADEAGVSPGDLSALLRRYSPCLVLIDEWVAFIRQTYGLPTALPVGSFDANLSFAQALTESFKASPGAFLVASLPSSDIEVGGEGGRDALKRLENTFDRVQSTWRPATTDESFEIVRRRLFQPLEAEKYAVRDAVAKAFVDLYAKAAGDFPPECRETDYERRIQNSYPIHPELFDRLFQDWSMLERFQKTRGVLRLMASVIHRLWENGDGSVLILPSSVPLDEREVIDEARKVLDEHWVSVVEKDVDGPQAIAVQIDRNAGANGRFAAARRVARTLFVGTAPHQGAAGQKRGIDDRRVKLGCVQPGENPSLFGDALRHLSDRATHVYVEQGRYWLATNPSVARLAQDRAAQLERKPDEVNDEIVRRIRDEQGIRGEFAKVYPCPAGGADVPDELETRLVILSPEQPHSARTADSPAMAAAKTILEQRGSGPRLYRNTLVFLAPDKTRLSELQQAVRQYLAWKSIHDEPEALNLDAFQGKQAKTKTEEANDTVQHRLPETFQWLLVPGQSTTQAPVEWGEVRLQGADRLAPRASKKLVNDGGLATRYGGTLLRHDLDRVPLWRGESASVKQLVEDFAQYLYLPRLKTPQVLLDAVRDGVSSLMWQTESFAYADFFDEKKKRFVGLRTAATGTVVADGKSLVIQSGAAAKQQAAELPPPSPTADLSPLPQGQAATGNPIERPPAPSAPKLPTRFYGVVEVDATRLGRDAGRIAQEVLSHLTGLQDAEVTVTIDIQAKVPEGLDQPVVRAVSENCRVLKFRSHGFEND